MEMNDKYTIEVLIAKATSSLAGGGSKESHQRLNTGLLLRSIY